MRRRKDLGYATSAPKLDSVTPTDLTVSAGQVLVLRGAALNYVDRVVIGGPASVLDCTNLSAASGLVLTCETPSLSSLSTGDYDVSVYRGSLYYRLRAALSVTSLPAPTITSVANAIATDVGDTAGAWALTITGTGFSGGGLTSATIGGSAVGSLVVVNDTTATCTVPTGLTAGQKDVVVTGPGGSATLTNGLRLWDPSQIGSSLKLWLRDEFTMSGSDITTWNDKSGNGWNASPGTTMQKGATINGRDTVEFVGTSGYYVESTPTTNISSIIAASAFHVWACGIIDTADVNNAAAYDNECIWMDFNGGYMGLIIDSTPQVRGYNEDGSEDDGDVTGFTAGVASLFTHRHTGGNVGIRVGTGASYTEVASGNTNAGYTASTKFRVGANYSNTRWMDGRLAEIFACNAALDATTDGYARSYFATRYALT